MSTDTADDADGAADQPCPACRGTGKVISNLGGEPSTIECPWCEGTGKFIPGHDARARHGEPAPTPPPAD